MKPILFALLPALLLPLAGCTQQQPPPASPTPAEEARPLTQEEIEQVNKAFSPLVEQDGVTSATPVSGFFTSYYDDVKDLDFTEFLRYFPGDGLVEEADQAEFDALSVLPDFPFAQETADLKWTSPSDLPVPIHRILRTSVDETLERYAGITTADLTGTDGTLYLPEYDAWYTFTSDFGPGTFVCAGGQVDEAAGSALLWTDTREDGSRIELTLERDGADWYIRAHRNTADDALLELLAGLDGKDIGSVNWYGPGDPPEAEELAALIRAAAAHPADHPGLTLNGSDTDVVWSLDCYYFQLRAGLEENVVEVLGGASLPDGKVHLEDEALYQLLRTSRDPPADLLPDPSAYAPYQEAIAAHLDGVCARAWEGRYTGWDIVEFAQEDGWTSFADGTTLEVWFVRSAFRAEPAEAAVHMLAGGMYVDSQLRAYGLDSAPLLLVAVPAGGEPFPLAFVPWDWWEGLTLAGVDSLDEALPLIAQAGELTAQGAEL